MDSVKVINVKNLPYYIFHAIINIENLDKNKLKIKRYKNFRETTFQFKTLHVS